MATTATAALAPSPGSATNPANVQITWNKALVAHLNRFKRYPNAARARGVQGEVSVTFTIDRRGEVMLGLGQKGNAIALLAPAVRTMQERKTPAADIEPFVEALSRAQRDSTLGSR